MGGDIDEKVLEFAKRHYKNRDGIELKTLDAQQLPFDDKSFDVILLYEAIYYIPQPEKFIEEARRVLKKNGVLIMCSVNKDWSDFNPSPYSQKYFSTPELYSLLTDKGFEVKMFAACPVDSDNFKDKMISIIKRAAVRLHLIPKTMKGKEKLKRLFLGRLKPLPDEICEGMASYVPPISIPHNIPNNEYKVIYAVAYVK